MKAHSPDAEIKNPVLSLNDTPGNFEYFLKYGVSLQYYGFIYISTYLDRCNHHNHLRSFIHPTINLSKSGMGWWVQPIVHVFGLWDDVQNQTRNIFTLF